MYYFVFVLKSTFLGSHRTEKVTINLLFVVYLLHHYLYIYRMVVYARYKEETFFIFEKIVKNCEKSVKLLVNLL